MFKIATLFAVSVLLCAAALGAQTEESVAEEVVTFEPANRVQTVNPKFPYSRQVAGREGWVRLNYMIDATGKPYDLVVAESSDDTRFEAAAIAAVEQFRYEPAVLNGQPIDSGTSLMITFALSGGKPGATDKFVRRYSAFERALKKDDRSKADDLLAKLVDRRQNLYEEAYMQLAKYRYAQKWGNEWDEYQALARATAMDGDRGFLPDDALFVMTQLTLELELKLNYLARALGTISRLRKMSDDAEHHAIWTGIEAQIDTIKNEGKPFSNRHVVGSSNSTVYKLLHSSFSLAPVGDGELSELRLHCDKGSVGFGFDPEIRYEVNRKWQNCGLIVIGTPGTEIMVRDGG